MYGNQSRNDFDGLDDHGNFFNQEVDSHVDPYGFNNDREVYPEFSDPTDYSVLIPLKNSSNFNMKQGMKFMNKGKFSNKKFQPYNLPTTSKNNLNNSASSVLNETENNQTNKNANELYKTNSPFNDNNKNMRFTMAKNKPNSTRSNFVIEKTKLEDTRQRMNFPGSKFRHLIGSVDQVLHWHKSVKNSDLCVMYEANGILECKRSQGIKQLLFIRGESGHTLQAVFYEIDRPIPVIHPKSPVVVTGRMIGFRKMQIFDVTQISQEDYQPIQRLSFLSQRALNEALE
ncbi:hypothetical protein O3M35_010602 [Rhynocoris fuscipes]|uniref:Uncharacterized protein n=1 Tax=Rhynocoris fuscipes TaxID=488301 RepID=A0AAW1D377_9HEMI